MTRSDPYVGSPLPGTREITLKQAARFRGARVASGLTQEALARTLDVSPSAIAAIEAGRARSLPEASFPKLEEVLGRFLGTAPSSPPSGASPAT